MFHRKKEESANGKTIRRVLKYIINYKFLVFFSLLLALATVALTLYAPVITGQAIDYILGPGNVNFTELLPLLERFALIVLFTALTQWGMNYCNNRITYLVVKDVRSRAFDQMQRLPLKYIDSHQAGDLLSRMVSDVDQFSDGLLMGFTQLFTGVITILGTLLFMVMINVKITLLVVCLTPLSFFVANYIAKKTFTMFKQQSETKGVMTSLIDEMIGGEKIIQAFGYEDRAVSRFEVVNEKLRKENLQVTFFSSLVNPGTRFINSMVYAGVGVAGAISALHGNLSVGQLAAFLSYANQYTKPFNEISGVVTELQNALACAARVFELIDEEPFPAEVENAVVLEVATGSVEVTHVDFSYDKDKELMKDFNVSVDPGQRIAIVGPTGCGKSTLINLLMRFYDVDAGAIAVDGRDIRHLTRRSLRANYGMVLQETWLKAASIRENIAYGKPDASMEEVERAAKEAYAHSFIKRLPQGYDTIISEDGGNLSQGQKQLLCITRVMLCLPPMLILDEATSSIDTRTEIKVQKAFARMMEGRTSFIVAHRLSTIKEADLILVMDHGTIKEQGTHEELLKREGFYAQLYNSQFAH